jgi:hypothetical protein
MKFLRVYKTIINDTPEGKITNGILRLVWTAPFKSDKSLVKAIVDYSQRGFLCEVVAE